MGVSKESIKRYLDEIEVYGLIKRDTYGSKQGWRRNIQFQYSRDLYFKKHKKEPDLRLPKKDN
jgi:hypothetical protein